jgi:asparagine synthase (glutamine-hydrolysing)
MAHGTEVRLPFLNHELVEFLFTLPPHFKIRQGWTKWLLRKTVEDKLPGSITWRKDKIGFEPPQRSWMENRDVEESIREGKKKLVDKGILDSSVLKKNQPHTAYAADGVDWRYWSSSFLF